MIVKYFTKDDGPESRSAHDLAKRLEDAGYKVEFYDYEDQGSTQLIELYDVYDYPAFLVVRDDGSLVEEWKGKNPLEADIKRFIN
jgi:UDP-glucose 6-dehydrogenase